MLVSSRETIADSVSCLTWGGFSGMAVILGVVLIKGGWVVDTRGTPSSSHMPNKPPHQSQTTSEMKLMCRRRSGSMLSYLSPLRDPSPSVLAFQCFAWLKKACRKTDLAISCCFFTVLKAVSLVVTICSVFPNLVT